MMIVSLILFLVVTVCKILCVDCNSDQPPYQVALHISLHASIAPVHICNGAIIQSSLVIVPAQCLYYPFLANETPILVQPSMFHVVAGSTNTFSDALTLKITEINICDKFNITTLENDLAILHLSSSLPLNSREDMKWIILDDYSSQDQNCLSIYNTHTIGMELLDYKQCINNASKISLKQNTHICSYYVLPSLVFECSKLDAFLEYNGDRGTGFICNDHLVAILSKILPLGAKSRTNCTDIPIKALYINLGSYLDWIYEIIAYKESLDLKKHVYTSSSPYRHKMGAITQSNQTLSSLSLIRKSSQNVATDLSFDSIRNNSYSNAKTTLALIFIYLCKMSITLTYYTTL